MAEYVYKGFKIIYNVEPVKNTSNLYRADGYAVCLMDESRDALPRKFHTEYSTLAGVQEEIKKLLQDYIDFEWREYNKMQEL
ncbi:hypothetical protein ACFORL_01030 [Legionella dresdenensis]|uniref:Uncharacterized protein n=1 Tax=Legionella dresdenensis TaxID=450200 RepID=A0ABV8CC43_9GAMM